MSFRRSAGLLTLATLLLHTASASAATLYDPALTWKSIHSPRFAVHYPDGARNLAVRVSRIAEENLDDVAALFAYAPDGRIDIVLSDASDRANGSAQVMPRNTIRLYLTAPTELTGLSSYDDWLRILIIHELAHICDIDHHRDTTSVLRWLLGKYIMTNGWSPQFLSEGVAVYAETVLTPTGRGRSSYVSMLLRMAALEDAFLEIDQAHIQYSDWPGPNGAYFYGGFFHLWLAQRYGPGKVTELHRFYAGMPIPYIYWPGAELVFDDSLPDLWQAWRRDELAFAEEVKAAVEAKGVTESERITHHGRNITGPRYHASGDFIIYSRSSPEDGATVRRVNRDGSDDRHLVLQTFSPRFAMSADGSSFYYSQNAINERFNNFADLYRYELESDETVKLHAKGDEEGSLRARDPDISPDGNTLVFVQNRLHQTWLTLGRIRGEERDELELRVLVPPSGDVQHASPRFSPDGTQIAVSTWFEGGLRDIVIIDADSGALIRRVTHDTALDGNPAWSPDGRYLLYESDRDGISNIYAFDTATEAYYRITRVVGGAFQADVAADGKTVLFRNASGIGFDIHEMPFDPSAWEALEYVAEAGYGPEQSSREALLALGDWTVKGWGAPMAREEEADVELRAQESEADYSPSPSLLPFDDNWVLFPALFFRNDEFSATATTIGHDALGTHSYVLSLGSGVYTKALNVNAGYFNDQWYPTFGLVGFRQAASYSAGSVAWRTYGGSASTYLPLKQRHTLLGTYTWERRRALTEDARLEHANGELALGDFGRLEVGYRYRFTRRFPYSVGEEYGRSVALTARWYSTAFGADFNEILFNLDGRAYLNNPFAPNHVLALRVAGAYALGPDYEERFALGGAASQSIFTVQTDRYYPLRGFELDRKLYPEASGMLAAYAEYRWPLFHIERGLWTAPVYLERLHAAFFADMGTTFNATSSDTLKQVAERAYRRARGGRLGSGLEGRADISLGWAFPLTLRLGAAWPLIEHGRKVPLKQRQTVWYFSLGSAI